MGGGRITHGHSFGGKSRTYIVWQNMKRRCANQKAHDYPIYGAKGIRVCKEWIDSFATFLADMGEAPPGMMIDRIDNSVGYCKENCRWATPRQQARNRSTNRMVTINGKTMCVQAWATHFGLGYQTFHWRLLKGWPESRLGEPSARTRRLR